MPETFTAMQAYEIDNIVNYFINYKCDKYGPTAITLDEFVDFLTVFETGWTRTELTAYLNDQFLF